MFSTFSSKAGQALRQDEAELFGDDARTILLELQELLDNKGQDYNNLTNFMENMPFGDLSWATLCWIKAHRAASLLQKELTGGKPPMFDAVDEVVKDLAVYAVGWLAFRRQRQVEGEVPNA